MDIAISFHLYSSIFDQLDIILLASYQLEPGLLCRYRNCQPAFIRSDMWIEFTIDVDFQCYSAILSCRELV